MATGSAQRAVTIERTAPGRYTAVSERGGRITVGRGEDEAFTPTELLLAAIGGCTSIDVDILTSRRAEPESFTVTVRGEKVRDADGNHLTGIEVTFRIAFPDGPPGDAARALLPDGSAARTTGCARWAAPWSWSPRSHPDDPVSGRRLAAVSGRRPPDRGGVSRRGGRAAPLPARRTGSRVAAGRWPRPARRSPRRTAAGPRRAG